MASLKDDIKNIRQVRLNWLFVGLMLAAITALSFPSYEHFDLSVLSVGEPSPQTYRVDQRYRVYDRYESRKRTQNALRDLKPVFVRDASVRRTVLEGIKRDISKLREGTLELSGETLPNTEAEWSRLRANTLRITEFLLDRGIIEDPALFKQFDRQRTLLIRQENSEGTVSSDTRPIPEFRETVIPLDRVPDRARAVLKNIYRNFSHVGLVSTLIRRNAQPTVYFLEDKYEKAVTSIEESHGQIYRSFAKGEVILARGEVVTPHHVALLREINQQEIRFQFTRGIASLGISVLGLIFVYLYIRQFEPSILYSSNKLSLLCVLVVLLTALCKLVELLSVELPPHVEYVIPFAAPVMIVAIMIGPELAFVLSIFLAFLGVSFFHFTFELFAMFLIGAFVGIFSISRVERRSVLIQAGLVLGGVQALTVALFHILRTGNVLSPEIGTKILWAGVNGVVFVPPLVIGLLPFLENIFDITTNFKLLELADLNHPLLRDLFERAPGSFQHSVMLSNLCERAARNIGANALLVRVGAYYHDLGKGEIAEYFIENQGDDDNPHDELKPTLSASILKSHVKKGVELAEEEGLPAEVIDMIEQHHGTTTMQFFYHKALEEGNDVSEEEFQYPGPRPQTREAGICMLGDAVEATSRTLDDPTPNSIREMVEEIVYDKFKSGQLNECDLTLKDLDVIVKTFTRVITSIHHQRIDYPDEVDTDDLEEMRDMDLREPDDLPGAEDLGDEPDG